MLFRLKIISNSGTTYSDWYTETPTNVQAAMQAARWENKAAKVTIERQQGPPTTSPPLPDWSLVDDPNPKLGGDLQLNSHTIIGQLEQETLVLDGGLLG